MNYLNYGKRFRKINKNKRKISYRRMSKTERKGKYKKYKPIIFLIIPIISFILMTFIIFNLKLFKTNKFLNTKRNDDNEIITKNITYVISKNINEEFNDMREYINMALNGTLYNPNEIFKRYKNPKISIVITVYNGEGYLRDALLSIQNQDFKDIEIIMVDDFSMDNSVELIKELMAKDPRISLYQNTENRGILYTKAKGVLNAKGKYVMTLDEDDLYLQKDAFSTLYLEAEKNNLDILGFSSVCTGPEVPMGTYKLRYIETPVLYQPDVPKRMYDYISGNVKRVGDVIWNYFFKTELFIKTIKQIDEKFFNFKMNFHDDFLFFFLLTRNAYNLRQIKRIFYIMLQRPPTNNTKIIFRNNEKEKANNNLSCLAYVKYSEFLLIYTNNTVFDKRIASFELDEWLLKNNRCRNNTFIREDAIKICNLFLQNEYIKSEIKNKIKIFLNETNENKQ